MNVKQVVVQLPEIVMTLVANPTVRDKFKQASLDTMRAVKSIGALASAVRDA